MIGIDWTQMPDGVLDGMAWLLGNLCLAMLLEDHLSWDETARMAPCVIADIREQLDMLAAEQDEMPPISRELASIAEDLSDVNAQLWSCLDRLEDWLTYPTVEGLNAVERDFRVAEERIETVPERSLDIEEELVAPAFAI